MKCNFKQKSPSIVCVVCLLVGSSWIGTVKISAETPRVVKKVEAVDGHPLAPVLAYARTGYRRIERDVQDYTCLLTRRERVAGKLNGYQHLFVKMRHQRNDEPLSIYLRFLNPTDVKGREVLYVEGQMNNDILVRRGGTRLPNMTLQLDPAGRLAMEENRYPITEIGVKQMVLRIIEVLEEDLADNEVQVKYYKNAKLNGRDCTHFEVVHPFRREGIRYHKARVFVDNELQLPVYFASYDWPKEQGGNPLLFEEYVYSDIRLNIGLTDRDFERSNPEYGFSTIEQAVSQDR